LLQSPRNSRNNKYKNYFLPLDLIFNDVSGRDKTHNLIEINSIKLTLMRIERRTISLSYEKSEIMMGIWKFLLLGLWYFSMQELS
jgi:hypothetical protein